MLTGLSALNALGVYCKVYGAFRTLRFPKHSGALVLLIGLETIRVILCGTSCRWVIHVFVRIYVRIYIYIYVCMDTHVRTCSTCRTYTLIPSASSWVPSTGLCRPSGDGSLYTISVHPSTYLSMFPSSCILLLFAEGTHRRPM